MKLSQVPLAALLLGGTACMTVQQVREPAQFIPQTSPTMVLVTYNDNSQVPVAQPQLRGDTLVGTWQGLGEPVAVPLSQVARIDAVQRDGKRTTLMIAGLTVLTAGGVYALIQAVTGGRPTCDYSYNPPTVPDGRCIGQNP